jgi:hypothetical protein
MATGSATYRMLNTADVETELDKMGALVKPIPSTAGFVNGSFNEAFSWMRDLGYDAVCLLQDDLIFSPLPSHSGSMSTWFGNLRVHASGLTFAHFEVFTHDPDMRRPPVAWDREDFDDLRLWHELMQVDRTHNGSPLYPANRDWYIRYEGTDRWRPWNRLGPTGFVVPIRLWEDMNGFDEQWGVFFDIDYPAEVRRRGLAPVWACPNVPWLHLHNQSVNPWADFAPGAWGDTEGAFRRKFNAPLTGFWHTNWEERWLNMVPHENA